MPEQESMKAVSDYLRALYRPGDVFEVRAPGYRETPRQTHPTTVSGYYSYDTIDAAAAAISELDRHGGAPGIYCTLNPVEPALLSRAANRLKPRAKETTQDKDIAGRRWLLIDVDPVRPSGISATRAELAAADQTRTQVQGYLRDVGWPSPLVVMSGNGYHLLYRIDAPADDGGSIRRALLSLAARFDTPAAKIDKSVFNAARIVKVAGTVCRKGDVTGDGAGLREHRLAAVLSSPAPAGVVTREQIDALAGECAQLAPTPAAGRGAVADGLECTPAGVRAWLESHGVTVHGERRNGTRTLLCLSACPINPDITSDGGSDIAVLVGDDGGLAYCNQHDRGRAYTWHDLRRALDPEYASRGELAPGVDLSQFRLGTKAQPPAKPLTDDPGPIPPRLLTAPGFVGELIDYCLSTAPYPNPVMAFCGALAMQAFLAGRKVRDSGDNRTNIYILGLAHSASGKDWPRKINARLAYESGLGGSIGDRFASGEGIQDALYTTPSMLFQTDEIDGMLLSVNRAKDARHESIMSTLLTIYSASNSVYMMRRRAGTDAPAGAIDQPCLVLFGTAIPTHYYDALSDRMLTNGFFARTLTLESGPRGTGQEPRISPLPPRLVETARWWADYRPSSGNLAADHPEPAIVPADDSAVTALTAARLTADAEYAKAEADADSVGTTVWGRVSEQTRKLALLYAVSEAHTSPRITAAGVHWAAAVVMHCTRRMLSKAATQVTSGSAFDADRVRVLRVLSEAGGRLPHSKLLRRMHVDAKRLRDVLDTMTQTGEVAAEYVGLGSRARKDWVLAGH